MRAPWRRAESRLAEEGSAVSMRSEDGVTPIESAKKMMMPQKTCAA